MGDKQQMEVLIVTDNFAPEFAPLTNDKSWAFQKFSAFNFIDLCLEWVTWLESPNVIVAFANQKEEVVSRLHEKWASNFKHLQVISVQDAHSVNDVLREVDSRHLLKSDFVLIQNCATFCSSNLAKQIEAFKARRRQNKLNILTLLYSEKTKNAKGKVDSDKILEPPGMTLLGFHSQTRKLVHYDAIARNSEFVQIQKNAFLTETSFRTDLLSCGIALCAHEFSSHFAGNYDFHTFDGIVHDILHNEEFLAQHIHLDIVTDLCAITANNFPAFFRTHQALLRRNCFPLTFENVLPNFTDFARPKHRQKQNIYSPELEKLEFETNKLKDCLFGQECLIGPGTSIETSTFGARTNIGQNAIVRSVIAGDGVHIDDEAHIEYSVLGNDVHIGKGARIPKGCVLGTGTRVGPGQQLAEGTVLMGQPWTDSRGESSIARHWRIESDSTENGQYFWKLLVAGKKIPFWNGVNVAFSSPENAPNVESENAAVDVDVTYQGNVSAFVSEVFESMQSILEDMAGSGTTSLDSELVDKVKLEINASKLAYNIPVDEVAKNVFLAFLRLDEVANKFTAFMKMYKNWSGLWSIYFKKTASHLQILSAIEEFSVDHEQFRRIVPNVLHFLNQTEELIDDKLIVDWYGKLDSESPLQRVDKLAELVGWLQNEEDEEDEDSDTTDEGVDKDDE